jgi:hypothetical protein
MAIVAAAVVAWMLLRGNGAEVTCEMVDRAMDCSVRNLRSPDLLT